MPLMRSKIRSRERGSTLIEVMIALLVLAIGLLGFAGMQTQGILTGRQAYLHSTAAFLAEDIIERIRANGTQSAAYSMLLTDQGTNNHCDTANCTDVQMVRWDQFRWQSRVASSLPNGQGQISTVQGSNAYVTATITINYRLDASSATPYTYTTTTQIYYN